MKAVKGNKEYTIGDAQKKAYQDAGYDIVDDDGEIIAHGRNKTVPYGEYAALKTENEDLKRRLSGAGEPAGGKDGLPADSQPAKKGKASGKAGG